MRGGTSSSRVQALLTGCGPGCFTGISLVKWEVGGMRWEGWSSGRADSFAAHAPEHSVERSVSAQGPPPPPSWIEGPAWCFCAQAPYLRCWHSQLTGGTLIWRAMYEAAVCAASKQSLVNKWNGNKWNLSTKEKKKVRLYFITQILFLYPRNC